MSGGTSVWDKCLVQYNEGTLSGGALYFDLQHNATITNSTFLNNFCKTAKKSTGYGGAICGSETFITVE